MRSETLPAHAAIGRLLQLGGHAADHRLAADRLDLHGERAVHQHGAGHDPVAGTATATGSASPVRSAMRTWPAPSVDHAVGRELLARADVDQVPGARVDSPGTVSRRLAADTARRARRGGGKRSGRLDRTPPPAPLEHAPAQEQQRTSMPSESR